MVKCLFLILNLLLKEFFVLLTSYETRTRLIVNPIIVTVHEPHYLSTFFLLPSAAKILLYQISTGPHTGGRK